MFYLDFLQVDLKISDEAYEKIATISLDNKLNARGLNLVTNELFKDVVFDIASGNYNTATLNEKLEIKLK